MKYEKGKKITDNCQFKKGKKYMTDSEELFEFSHIGETGSPYFKDEGQGKVYHKEESEYNCIGFGTSDFYEAIEVQELPDVNSIEFNGKEYLTEEALLQRFKEKGFGLYKIEEREKEKSLTDEAIKLQELAKNKRMEYRHKEKIAVIQSALDRGQSILSICKEYGYNRGLIYRLIDRNLINKNP